jgi:hypothetical protein
MPARAAPPAINGVFAFDAACATFSPVLRTAVACGFALDASCVTFSVVFSTGPFEDGLRLVLAREALAPSRLVDRLLLVELFLLVDLLFLGRLRVDRLLEDRVVWAISRLLGFHASFAFRAGGANPLPGHVRI